MAISVKSVDTGIIQKEIVGNFELLEDGIGKPFKFIEGSLEDKMKKFSEAALNAINKVRSVFDKITSFIKNIGKSIFNLISSIISGAIKIASSFVKALFSLLEKSGISKLIKNFLKVLFGALGLVGLSIDGVYKTIVGILASVLSFGGSLKDYAQLKRHVKSNNNNSSYLPNIVKQSTLKGIFTHTKNYDRKSLNQLFSNLNKNNTFKYYDIQKSLKSLILTDNNINNNYVDIYNNLGKEDLNENEIKYHSFMSRLENDKKYKNIDSVSGISLEKLSSKDISYLANSDYINGLSDIPLNHNKVNNLKQHMTKINNRKSLDTESLLLSINGFNRASNDKSNNGIFYSDTVLSKYNEFIIRDLNSNRSTYNYESIELKKYAGFPIRVLSNRRLVKIITENSFKSVLKYDKVNTLHDDINELNKPEEYKTSIDKNEYKKYK